MRTNARTPIRAILVFAALGFCSLLPSAAAEKLRVGKAVTGAFTFTPLDVGIEAGIFKRHGIEVEKPLSAAAPSCSRGSPRTVIDIGIGSGPELAFVAKGAPVLGVAAMAGEAAAALRRRRRPTAPIKPSPISRAGRSAARPPARSPVGSCANCRASRAGDRTASSSPSRRGAGANRGAAHRRHEGATIQVAAGYRLEELGVGEILYRFGDIVPHFIIHVIYARNGAHRRGPGGGPQIPRRLVRHHRLHGKHKDEMVRIAAPVMGVVARDRRRASMTS